MQSRNSFYASSYLAESGEPSLQTWRIANGALLRLDYFLDGTKFWLDPAGELLSGQCGRQRNRSKTSRPIY